MRRPRVSCMVLALTLGAVTTCVIAWAAPPYLTQPQRTTFFARLGSERERLEIAWPWPVTAAWPSAPATMGTQARWCYEVTWAGHFGENDSQIARPEFVLSAHRVGWPFLAFQGVECLGSAKLPNTPLGLVDIPPRWRPWSPSDPMTTRLFVMPIWSGLLGNVMLFTIIAYVGLLGVSAARAARRRRRGHCPACAYDTRGLAICPECGVSKSAPAI